MLLWDTKTQPFETRLDLIDGNERMLVALDALDYSAAILLRSHQRNLNGFRREAIQKASADVLIDCDLAEGTASLPGALEGLEVLLENGDFKLGEWEIVAALWYLATSIKSGPSSAYCYASMSCSYKAVEELEITQNLEEPEVNQAAFRDLEAENEQCMKVIDHHVALLEGLPALPAFPFNSLREFARTQP